MINVILNIFININITIVIIKEVEENATHFLNPKIGNFWRR